MVAAALDKAPADIDGVWDDDVFEVFLDQVLDQDLDQGSILTPEDEARQEHGRRGQVEQPVPAFPDILHPELLEQIDAGSVSVVG